MGADQARDRDESRNINPPSAFFCLPQDSLPSPFPSPLSPQVSSRASEWTAHFCAREGRGERKKVYLSLQSETRDRQDGPFRTLCMYPGPAGRSLQDAVHVPGTGRTVPQDAVHVPGTGRMVPQDVVPALQENGLRG